MSTQYKVIHHTEAATVAREAMGSWSSDSSPYAAQSPVTEVCTPVTRAFGVLLRGLPYLGAAFVLAQVLLYADFGIGWAALVAVGVVVWGYLRIEANDRADSPVALERDRLDAATEVQLARLQHERDLRQMALEAALHQMGATNGEQYTVISGKQLPGAAAHGGALESRKQLSTQDYQADGTINDGAYRPHFETSVR